jgi:ABC-2 type transport system permease protein
VRRLLVKLWAFLKRDFLSEVSYRLNFLLNVAGMLLTLLVLRFWTGLIDPHAKGFDGIRPLDWFLVGGAFQFYFSTALYSFSAKIRNEQLLGTLEAMLVSPTPTSMVVFSSAAWDFTYGAFRILIYLAAGVLFFGVALHVTSPAALALGVALTLLSSAGLGILSASFILYFKRGDPINYVLSGMTALFGSVMFPIEQLPERWQFVSKFLPITWSLRVVRMSLLKGQSLVELRRELAMLALLTAILLPGGLLASRFAIRRAKREGTLIQY